MPPAIQIGPFRWCPGSGRLKATRRLGLAARCLYPLIGLAALAWWAIRVLPKPDRAAYPCQRVAMPIAWGFLASAAGWIAALRAARLSGDAWRRGRRLAATAGAAAMLAAGSIGLHGTGRDTAAYEPPDPPNTPMGIERGIHPGRVAWVFDPSAARWNGNSNNTWWHDTNTPPAAVRDMLARGLRTLTGEPTDAAAWNALFRHFNRSVGRGDRGYQAGERVAIKINCNNSSSYADVDNQADASPQMVRALLHQLINAAGVPASLITVYEAPRTAPTRVIPDRIYQPGAAEFPGVRWVDCLGTNGRVFATWTVSNHIHYATNHTCGRSLPTVVVEADYLVNMALLKRHGTAGVTLTAKNHYGSITNREHTFINTSARGLGVYSPFVELTGHRHLGGKTLLFMVDALYGAINVGSNPTRFRLHPFNNHWSSSLFLSQDPVAIDSVGFDLLLQEFGPTNFITNADGYLHESALANNPPSGTFYAPNGDNVRLGSLGVHEHCDDPVHRRYSRNLGRTNGIELVYTSPFPFQMDGLPDSSQYRIADRNGLPMYAAVSGDRLYVATRAAGNAGGVADHMIFITTNPASLRAAPWAKGGQVAFNASAQPWLGDRGTTNVAVCTNGGAYAMWAAATGTGGVMEASFDLRSAFGAVPSQLYICVAAYQTHDGGALLPEWQIPAGNGDGNVDAGEFIAVPVDAIRDGNLDGRPDSQDPAFGFAVRAAERLAGGVVRLRWPSIPGRRYRLLRSEDLAQFAPWGADIAAGPGVFEIEHSAPDDGNSARFHAIEIVN